MYIGAQLRYKVMLRFTGCRTYSLSEVLQRCNEPRFNYEIYGRLEILSPHPIPSSY